MDLALKLRLFDTIVIPIAFYGLSVAPLTAKDIEKLASTQRHMLRCMAGYVKLETDDWSDMYRRLKEEIANAMERQPIRQWSTEICKCKKSLITRLQRPNLNTLLGTVSAWNPTDIFNRKLVERPKRSRGRPRTTWTNFPT